MKLYEGQIVPEVRGPPGRPVELFHTDDQPTMVAGVIERLCGTEEILPQDVVVLSSHGRANSEVAGGLPGRYALTPERGSSATTSSSPRSARSRGLSRRS